VIGYVTVSWVRFLSWQRAFDAFSDADQLVTLTGREIRVAGSSDDQVRDVLRRAGLDADLDQISATLDETMITVTR